MRKLIVTAATLMEIEPFVQHLRRNFTELTPDVFQNETWSIHIFVSGVGMMSTAFSLATKLNKEKFDAAIQVGIAGAFNTEIQLGELVTVASEQYGDLGAEDHSDYIDIFDLGFLDKNIFPFSNGKLINPTPFLFRKSLKTVESLSVNTVSGNKQSIEARTSRYHCDIESMEGVAFHYSCLLMQIPFMQVRAISNYVTPRNKSEWQLKLAIDNLNQYLIDTFSTN